jgi:hypothetical protein
MIVLVTAAPAAAVTGGYGVSEKLRPLHVVLPSTVKVSDRSKSCQAGRGSAASKHTGLLGSTKRHAVVACEQPPKANTLSPDSVAKATAAALSVLG